MQRIKLGVIGCGVMGVRHVKAAQDSGEFEVIAVADLREQLAKDAAAKHSVPKVYGNGDALLDDSEVEAVVLAMPAFARTPLALHAFRNGKHVLTEKPVAMNAQEVERMIEARGKLTAGCCSPRFRLTQSAEAATAFVATGALGPLRVVRCRALSAAGKPPQATPPAWRLKKSLNGGGILLNWGCYDLDYLLGITGWTLKPKLVLAQTWTVPPQFESHIAPGSDAETYFTAFIRCESGTVITFERGEYMPAQADGQWQIVGTKGSLKLTMTAPGAKRAIIHDDTTTQDGVITKTLWEGDDNYGAVSDLLIRDFAAAIRERRQPKTGLEQSLVVQKISDAIYASAEQGRTVEIA